MYDILEKVRSNKPLVHHITNWVTIYDCANMTRTVGALPVMAHAIEESADMASIASSLVLNIGTLTPELVESMIHAGKRARERGIPVVLDVVGVGATKLRDEKAFELLETCGADIIKGNASEIAKIAGEDVITRGVESTAIEVDPVDVCVMAAKKFNAVVVMTGVVDIVTDGETVYTVSNGCEMMGHVVGTGCMAASVIGAFAGVEKDYARAAAAALACYEIAAECAAEVTKGPGTFKERFFDEVYALDRETVASRIKVEERKV